MKEKSEIKNVAASVKERLRNIASQTSKEFQSVIRQYVQERFLFRLSKSVYSKNFILKGALLFVAHDISRNRPTRVLIFDDKFKLDEHLQMLWLAFLERSKLASVNSFPEVVTKIQSFIEPIFDKKNRNKWDPLNWEWE
ncbi:MAG: hypothetical protein HXY49_08935 [Ignavibacteriaceae bacterium]|nr:hypothetical protein [Ignavibacteriaceae bacterium]